MTTAKKAGLIFILIGICLPTATLPFITEFKPVPELCLTSNFFQNMGNMIVVLGNNNAGFASGNAGAQAIPFSIPYRYLFSLGVILVCTGLVILVLYSGGKTEKKEDG